MDKQQEFKQKILATFRIEAQENIRSMSSYLLELEKQTNKKGREQLFESLYRSAHSLKGASRAVDFHDVESLCHSFEDVMIAVKTGEINFDAPVFDVLYATVDLLEVLLNAMQKGTEDELADTVVKMQDSLALAEAGLEFEIPLVKEEANNETHKKMLVEQEQQAPEETGAQEENPESDIPKQNPVKTKPGISVSEDTIRVSVSKLDNLLVQAEELLSIKLRLVQRNKDIKAVYKRVSYWNRKAGNLPKNLKHLSHTAASNSSLPKDFLKVDEFYSWSLEEMGSLEKDLHDLMSISAKDEYDVGLKIDHLLDDVKKMIMVPFSSLFDGFHKMIRDLAKDLNKKTELKLVGENIEIDRRILERIKTPMLHILRNSIDYGIELPNERTAKGKAETGTITIVVEQTESNKIQVKITDDGAGINLEALKKVYLKNKQIHETEQVPREKLLNYIFRSGISTGKIVTDLSGRGLGMAIVQDAVEELGGNIEVSTEKGKFTTFLLTLPLSIVTFRDVLVKVGENSFIIPTQKVKRILRLDEAEITTKGNRPHIKVNEKYMPLTYLAALLGLKSSERHKRIPVMVLEVKGTEIALGIDEVVGEQEVLTKSFNRQLKRVPNIMGATILGSGEVVPILNASDLLMSAKKEENSAVNPSQPKPKSPVKKNILIVEDSITSRTLLKNILEASGYVPTTAIDGIDGYTKLKQGNYSAVVTDVEMPRMNGFELTAKIRQESKYAELPIVLVTSLSKREHKEKGIEAGANAYIVKSSFNEMNLIETLQRLIV